MYKRWKRLLKVMLLIAGLAVAATAGWKLAERRAAVRESAPFRIEITAVTAEKIEAEVVNDSGVPMQLYGMGSGIGQGGYFLVAEMSDGTVRVEWPQIPVDRKDIPGSMTIAGHDKTAITLRLELFPKLKAVWPQIGSVTIAYRHPANAMAGFGKSEGSEEVDPVCVPGRMKKINSHPVEMGKEREERVHFEIGSRGDRHANFTLVNESEAECSVYGFQGQWGDDSYGVVADLGQGLREVDFQIQQNYLSNSSRLLKATPHGNAADVISFVKWPGLAWHRGRIKGLAIVYDDGQTGPPVGGVSLWPHWIGGRFSEKPSVEKWRLLEGNGR